MIALPAAELDRHGPVGQLPPQLWLEWPETQSVIAALQAEGTAIRFVGGCVRDSLLARDIQDIDIATPDRPDQVAALLAKAGLRMIPTGIAHGTLTARVGQRSFEITTLRRDVENFGRHARVEFSESWMEDAERRDFTINALSCSPDRMIFDYHEGLADLAAGRVRFVGSAQRRIEEDVLRLLRYFRFYAHYGRPPTDVFALAACRANAPRLVELSCERLRAELFKLLAAPDPATVFLLMQGERVLPVILPEAVGFGRLRALTFLETRALVRPHIAPDPLRRLASLIDQGAQDVAQRFALSRADTKRLLALVAPPPEPLHAGMAPPAVRRLLHRLGAALFRDQTLLAWSRIRSVEGRISAEVTNRWTALLDQADQWVVQKFPLQGNDLLTAGQVPGPTLGALLADLEEWWITGDFQAGREELLSEMHRRLLPSETGAPHV